MKFNLEAAKAYVGGIVGGAAASISTFVIGLFESSTGIDLPTSVEGFIATGVAFVIGYIAVYFTPNKKPAA